MKKTFNILFNNKSLFYLSAVFWIILLSASYFQWESYISQNVYNLALKEARTNFNKDVIYRRWNAKEGGVYVHISDYTKPNKYLDVPNRDIVTKDGMKLTLVNPAYMTRLVHELENVGDSVTGHITSLKPIRPGNKADAWETKALTKFENGLKEYSSLESKNGQVKLRYMAPLFTETPCLKCHAKQGYKLGDIRGGISIDIPYKSYSTIAEGQKKNLLILYLIIGFAGLIVIYVVSKMQKKHKNILKLSEEKYKTLFFQIPLGVMYFDYNGVIIDCNELFVKIIGSTKSALVGLNMIKQLKDKKIIEAVKTSLKEGEANYEGNYSSVTAEKITAVRIIFKGIRNSSGKIISGICLVEDVTERVKARSIIDDMLQDLEISSEELKEKNIELEKAREDTLILVDELQKEIVERKRVEADLMESEERHRLISNLTSDYIFQTKISEGNNPHMFWAAGSFEKITGYTLEEYQSIGGWRAVLYPDDVELDKAAFEKISNNEQVTIEVRIVNKSGAIIWVRSHGSPIWDEKENKLVGIVGATKDITEEKQNKLTQQIQYNIANAAVTANSTGDLIAVVKNELSQIINTSELYIAFYDDVTGMFKMDVYEDSQDKIETWKGEKSVSGYVMKIGKPVLLNKKEILKLAESGEIDIIGTLPELWLGVPLRIYGRNIGIIAAQSYDNPKAFDNSNVKALEIIANQLSLFIERKRAEADTIKLSRAIIQSPVSVVITDYDGNIEYVNPKFTEVTGYTLQEALGQNSRILKSGEQTQEFYENLWATILSGKNWKGEFHNKKKNGELYWEKATISPIVNDEREITHFVAIKEDITGKKKMLDELIEAKEKAEVSEKVKTEFLAQMSHEIRSPLNVILNFVSLIKTEIGSVVNEDLQFGFQSIDSSSKRIIRTIDLILNMTDLQAGSYKVSNRKFDAVRTLNMLVTEYKQNAATKNIELKQNIPFKEFIINSDEYAFSQILGNLIDNAIKYTDIGQVEVEAKQTDDNKLKVSIADTGIGISKEFLPKLFSTFTQEEQGYTRSYDGNGLGMALVKRYCDLINANISVESEKGKGTTFTLIVPNFS